MPGNNSNYSTIQGLNLVYPQPDDSSASSNSLTSPSEYPDFTAQLDLWTNLSFASDEPPFIDNSNRDSSLSDFRNSSVGMDKDPQSVLIADADNLPSSLHLDAPPPTTSIVPSQAFDISSFLAGFGIDPFLVPPHPSSPKFNPIIVGSDSQTIPPPEAEAQLAHRANKRPRTRKSSLSSSTASDPSSSNPSSVTASAFNGGPGSPSTTFRGRSTSEGVEDPANAAILSTTEDKRRRNTAASARFRAKKKEREQAMEKRSKELESRVNELERECEGLRRENGWLKGLVVGVTSGNPVPIPTMDERPPPPPPTSPAPPVIGSAQDSPKKRKREPTHE